MRDLSLLGLSSYGTQAPVWVPGRSLPLSGCELRQLSSLL